MKVRMLTTVIALIVFLPILLRGDLVLMIFANILALIALKELLNMNVIKFVSVLGLISVVGLTIIMLPQHVGPWVQVAQSRSLTAMSPIILSYTALSKNRFNFIDAASCLVFVAYVGIGSTLFYEMRSKGLYHILYVLLAVWLINTGAYLFSKIMGKYEFRLVISPNRTIEGFIDGLFCSLIVPPITLYSVDFSTNAWVLLGATLILSLFGQLGDLVESGFKRHFGAKGSGRILPGHGSILDRFNSFMFVLPLLNTLSVQS